MMERFAECFDDVRRQHLIEHEVVTLVAQRVFGIALGYEDLNDHDELRHDPIMAVLAGKLAARREDCAPLAGKSTLNRLELGRLQPTRYHKISGNPIAIKRLFVDLFLEAHERAPDTIVLDLDATDDPVHGEQEGLRADSGFARDELMAWCEANGVDFVFGLQQNERLIAEIECELYRAEAKSRRTGKPARYFREFKYRTRRSWSRERRVVGKAE